MSPPQQKRKEQSLNMESVTWGELTWISIERPGEPEIEYLAENYSFHTLDLDDCLSRIQRPKIDDYPDYLFVVLHFPVFNVGVRVTTPSQVAVFIGNNYLITLHNGDLKPLVKLFEDCQLNEETRQEHFGNGSGYLLYRVVDRLVDYCLPILSKISDNIEKVEEDIFSTPMPKAIREISILRRDVISFRRIIWPMRAVIGSLENRVRRFTNTDLSVYFGDVVDHTDKIWDGLDEYKEVIEGLNDTHDSLATNRTNEVIRILTIIATILLPFLIISSFYGMNIPLPGGVDKGSVQSFLLLLGGMVVISGGMLYFFRRRHWI